MHKKKIFIYFLPCDGEMVLRYNRIPSKAKRQYRSKRKASLLVDFVKTDFVKRGSIISTSAFGECSRGLNIRPVPRRQKRSEAGLIAQASPERVGDINISADESQSKSDPG